MAVIALFLLIVAALAVTVARWTSLHPVVVGLIAGLSGSILGLLIAGGALSAAVWPVAGIAFVITAACGTLGAFIGWLRRDFVKRNN